jgi:hypothetical protein
VDEQIPNVIKNYIDNMFTYKSPTKKQIELLDALRIKTKEFAYFISLLCIDSREKVQAINKLEEVKMWASSAILRHENKDA